jgi:hypothetical protein
MRSNFIVLTALSILVTNDIGEEFWEKKKIIIIIKNFNEIKLMNTNNNYISSLSRWDGSGSSPDDGGDYFSGGSGFIYYFFNEIA